MTSKELREKRAPLSKQIKEQAKLANEEGRKWTAEDEAAWKALNADYDAKTAEIETQERDELMSSRVAQVTADQERVDADPMIGNGDTDPPGKRERRGNGKPTEEQRALALQAWARAGHDVDLTDEHREAAQLCGYRLGSRTIDIQLWDSPQLREARRALYEPRALSAVTGSAGAFTIPEGFVPRLERALLAFGGMLQIADILRTTTGENLPWPTTDDTSNTGELLGENTAANEQDVAFGAVVLQAYQYSSKMVKVPFVLLQDSAFDLASTLGSMLGERLGRIANTHWTTGDGAAKPYGVLTQAYLGKTAASATVLDWEEILDLVHSIDPDYRTQGCRFMFHDNVALAIRKIVDGQGRPLWQDSPNVGIPSTLRGYPYLINQQMTSTIESAAKVMTFGLHGKYKIRMVGTLRLKRLEERYAELDQIAFLAWMRMDGVLIDAGTHPVKYMLMA